MPSILGFFKDNTAAYNCLLEVRRKLPSTAKAYTVAQYEYAPEESGVGPKLKVGYKGRSGMLTGLLIGILVSLGLYQHIFKVNNIQSLIILILFCIVIGAVIELFVMAGSSFMKPPESRGFHERGDLILVIENPGDLKDELMELVQKYHPERLKVY